MAKQYVFTDTPTGMYVMYPEDQIRITRISCVGGTTRTAYPSEKRARETFWGLAQKAHDVIQDWTTVEA